MMYGRVLITENEINLLPSPSPFEGRTNPDTQAMERGRR
jgi:hypothetical protein